MGDAVNRGRSRKPGAALLASGIAGLLCLAAVVVARVDSAPIGNPPGSTLAGSPANGVPGPASISPAATTGGIPARAGKPNIVVIMADDMRADEVRFMPNVRKLIGSRGLTYRNSFSPYPLCCPARASFLSGQYAHNHGVMWNRRPWGFGAFDNKRTVATSLKQAGYRTALVGKYLNEYGRAKVKGGAKLRSSTYVPPGWTDWYAATSSNKPRYRGSDPYNYYNTLFNINGRLSDRAKGRYQTNVIGDMSTKLIRKYSRGSNPFFLYIAPVAPHSGNPRESDDPKVVKVGSRRYAIPSPARPSWVRGRFNDQIGHAAGLPAGGAPSEGDISDKPRDMRRPLENVRLRKALRNVTRQRAEALYVLDRQVGRIIKTLKQRGVYRDTVVMFTSDNGYFLGEHRIPYGKTRAHEPSLRVPFLLAGPGIPVGVRNDPVRTFDLTATILDLAHAKPPRRADGRSLTPSFEADLGWSYPIVTEGHLPSGAAACRFGDDSDAETVMPVPGYQPSRACRQASSATYPDGRTTIGIRTARWKLLRYAGGETELYDLDADPNELNSLATDPDYAPVLRQLTQVWQAYRNCAGSACATPLPADLQADPVTLTRTTQAQRAGVLARYGQAW